MKMINILFSLNSSEIIDNFKIKIKSLKDDNTSLIKTINN